MPYLPSIDENTTQRILTETFTGYDHKLKIAANEWYEMQNMTSDHYPLLANRQRRGTVSALNQPLGMIAKDALCYIDGPNVVFNGTTIAMQLSTAEEMLPKQLVSMGAYLVIFPDQKYLNTQNLTDYGSINASYTSSGDISYTPCNVSGENYSGVTVSAAAPADPTNGTLWLDTSQDPHTLKQYSSTSDMWVQIPTVYTKISAGGIGSAFSDYDGVTISGASGNSQIEELNADKVIYKRDDDYIVVVGLLDAAYTQTSGSIEVTRQCPDMDYVCECMNRIWGCKYGIVDGKPINEIYCCKLGDFKNWNVFLGLSTDAWRASIGSDGVFTGAVNYLGYPTFFKERVIHRVAISSSGAHQISDTVADGVQKGSWQSLQVVGQTLFYKGRAGVYAYSGALPSLISDALGGEKYYKAVSGSFADKYYISMQDGDGVWHLFAYDSAKGMWHREDNLHALCFTRCDDELFCIDAETRNLLALFGTQGTLENAIDWSVTSGVQHYEYPDRKYVTRYLFRIKLPIGSRLKLYIMYDSDGVWRYSGTVNGSGLNSFVLPVRPRRCDHLQIRLDGTGDFRMFSISRILEQGSDAG